MQGGVSDLYLLTLASGDVRRLTSDRYADLHPAWSPDGRVVAFATDRGAGTNLETLSFAPLKLATIDVETASIREIPVFAGAKHINPQFAPNGSDLYFIADPDGYSDVYRLDLATGAAFRVTRLVTGVSGITYLSPALTVAPQTADAEEVRPVGHFRSGSAPAKAVTARGRPRWFWPWPLASVELMEKTRLLLRSRVAATPVA